MEAIGTISALAHLLQLSIKTSKAAKSLVQSFLNAPEELVQLAIKLDHLRSQVEQLHLLNKELPVSDSSALLPEEHQEMLSSGLEANLKELETVRSLCSSRSGSAQTFRTRLRWTALDRRKTDQILGRIARAGSQTSTLLGILGIRLASLNRVSLQTLGASQTHFQAELRQSFEAIKVSICTEIQNVIESKIPKNLEATMSVSEETVQSVPNENAPNTSSMTQEQIQGGLNETNERQPQTANRYKLDQNKLRKQSLFDVRSLSRSSLELKAEPGERLIEHHMRRSFVYYSLSYGNLGKLWAGDKCAISTMLRVQSNRIHRRLRFVFEVGFNVLCQRVLHFELNLQQSVRHWIGMPTLNCSVTVFNVRQEDTSIFRACQKRDLGRIRYLLESGQASIYDCDDKIGGLLEYVLQGDYKHFWGTVVDEELRRIQQVVEYLLDQGCDPNKFYGTITNRKLPALLFAFDRGYSSAVSAMLSRGADMISYGPILAGLLHRKFKWKIQLLRSMGFSDWQIKLPAASGLPNSLLHGACDGANFSEVLFALEIAHIDPNSQEYRGSTPLGNATINNFLKGAVVLIECGAKINSGAESENISQVWSIPSVMGFNETTHYLLLQGAGTHLANILLGETIWHDIWIWSFRSRFRWWPDRWSFTRLEGGLAHLFLHGLNPAQLYVDPNFLRERFRLDEITQDVCYKHALKLRIQPPEIARLWSYGDWIMQGGKTEERIAHFDYCEEDRTPQAGISWSRGGMIYRQTLMESSGEDEGEYEDDPFFRGQTQFYRHISSPEGRRQLSRFPLVLALCDALQFAGYRAEMDDDGDIWYDAGDGDRYFDAREEQVEGLDDHPANICPICQDFERHGLGHVLQEAEEAKRELREYREKVKAASNQIWSI